MNDTAGFTHVIVSDEPFFKTEPHDAIPADTTCPAETKVILIGDCGGYSRVATDGGLVGFVKTNSLRPVA